ncbi:MAG TPA: UDP-N-acetylglucosamine 2-epimerase (non-hydrolyzing), partial [Burkholderiales bacterium]|nr:UDP-N-acetylglucosamine 2-epimerase (non-hydrolyzing) [Burkholderiales bacterium]
MTTKASKKIVCIIGTRPEVIKMAPVIRALRAEPRFRLSVLCSGQHRDLLAPLLDWFEIEADDNLGVMTEDQSLAALTSRLMTSFD